MRTANAALPSLLCLAVAVLATLAGAPAGHADPSGNASLICPLDPPLLDAASHLRAVSLDLRGTLPEMPEYEAMGLLPAAPGAPAPKTPAATSVPATLIDAWLASPAFASQVVRRHRDLLWNNLAANSGRLMPTTANLGQEFGLYYRTTLAPQLRGAKVPCLDEPAEYTPQGQIVFTPQPDGTKREGWVMVQPYWAPKTSLKVCAQDAQDDVVSPGGTPCGGPNATGDLGCGCGPNLRYCLGGGADLALIESFAESLDRQIAQVVLEDRPYTDLFTEAKMWVNGPIVHYDSHGATNPGLVRLIPLALDPGVLPNLAFTDRNVWVQIPLPPQHAGILTSPAFLLRFQTQRARATRFFNAFLCQPFQAPASGIDVSGAAMEPDLQKRAGCKYCHALLEPASAYWGRWTASGGGWLGPASYPPQRADCTACALTGAGCSADCNRFYMTKAYAPAEKPFLGWLFAYNYRLPQHIKNIEQGPRLLALTAVADHRLPRCVARSTAEWLLGRELTPEELPWTDELAVAFAAQQYSYRKLVKAVVQSEVYRRVR